MSEFTCKDCLNTFPTAKEFVYHIDDCVPVVDDSAALLQEAVKLLKKWVKTNGEQPINLGLKDFQKVMKLSHQTEAWLKDSGF